MESASQIRILYDTYALIRTDKVEPWKLITDSTIVSISTIIALGSVSVFQEISITPDASTYGGSPDVFENYDVFAIPLMNVEIRGSEAQVEIVETIIFHVELLQVFWEFQPQFFGADENRSVNDRQG